MCGLVCFAGPNAGTGTTVRKMMRPLKHRGPDSEGLQIFQDCELGHLRLSIIDLRSRSDQPMRSSHGNLWLVFNGEIYNFKELKTELADYQFQTHSDSEVILAAYHKWGADCVHRFNGMFAFVIYDTSAKTIFAARDRFGIKPLFYSVRERDLFLASEAKAILATRDCTPNNDYLQKYISFGKRLEGHESCFNEISQIPPGHRAFFHNGDLKIERYYDLKEKIYARHPRDCSPSDVLEQFQHLFQSSVELRTRSDVPISLSFSGGLDSSSILHALHVQDSANKVLVQAAVSRDVPQDSLQYIDNVAASFGVNVQRCQTENFDFIRDLDLRQMSWHCETPFKASHYLDKCLAARSKENGFTVILDGNGADEHLLGYYPHCLAAATDALLAGDLSYLFSIVSNKLRSNDRFIVPDIITTAFARVFGLNLGQQHLNRSLPEIVEWFFDDKLQALLQFRDRSSMAFSTELRLPFLDYRLVEAMLALPAQLRINAGGQKAPLRRYASLHLPNSVLERKKNSFLKPELPRPFVQQYRQKMYELRKQARQEIKDFLPRNSMVPENNVMNERLGQVELWYRTFVG